MEKFKADHKAVMLTVIRQMYPNMSEQQLESEYYKSVTRVKTKIKTASLIFVAGLVGYFAGKRK